MVSIIVPVYKCENSLRRCVESILTQTYENIELILVDDGSPDGSGALCDLLAEQDARIRVIHKENGGPSSARNRGLDAAKGTYIQFVDSDDYIDPDMTARLVERMQQQAVQQVVCGLVYVHPDREERRQFADIPRVSVREMVARIPGFVKDYFPNSPCTRLYLRKYIDFRFDENVHLGEDLMFNLEYYRRIESISVMEFCPYRYVVENPESITGSRRMQDIPDVLSYWDVGIAFYREYADEETAGVFSASCASIIHHTVLEIMGAPRFGREERRYLVGKTLKNEKITQIFQSARGLYPLLKISGFFIMHPFGPALRLLAWVQRKRVEARNKA